MFALAVGFPKGMATETNINIISIESARLIAKIGIVLKPIFLVCLTLFFPLGIVNLLPIKNYPRRLVFGSAFLVVFSLCGLLASLPMITVFSLDGAGIVGTLHNLF